MKKMNVYRGVPLTLRRKGGGNTLADPSEGWRPGLVDLSELGIGAPRHYDVVTPCARRNKARDVSCDAIHKFRAMGIIFCAL